jgi:hypothetical protein
MAIPYQDAGVPWWYGRSMFRMIHETFITEYMTKRSARNRGLTPYDGIPYEAGVVGFWVSSDGLVMSADQPLHRFVLVGMDPLDRVFLDAEVSDAQANLYWSAYVQGYWLRETNRSVLSGEWIWVPNPVYAGYVSRGELVITPTKPDISDKFLADTLTSTSAHLYVA